jgi:CheY-like chemotaxis protein
MPGVHGIDVLKRFKEIDGTVEVIIATGCGSMNSAVEALRHGAYDYITKPVVNLDQDLLTVVRGALGARQAKLLECPRAEVPVPEEPPTRISFYEGLEALAREPMESENKDRLPHVIGDFLAAHLDATAAFLLYHGDGGVTFVEGWGNTKGREFPYVVREETQMSLLAHLNGGWEQMTAQALESLRRHHLPSAKGLHVTQIPLSFAARRTGRGDAETRLVLLVFRQGVVSPEPYPPGPELLGLVLGKLLEPLLAERVGLPDQDLLALAATK